MHIGWYKQKQKQKALERLPLQPVPLAVSDDVALSHKTLLLMNTAAFSSSEIGVTFIRLKGDHYPHYAMTSVENLSSKQLDSTLDETTLQGALINSAVTWLDRIYRLQKVCACSNNQRLVVAAAATLEHRGVAI